MNKILFCLLLCGVVTISAYNILQAPNYFEEFVQRFNKSYSSETEKLRRFKIFEHNLHEIIHKNKNDSAKYEINKFSDLSKDETIAKYTGLSLPNKTLNFCKVIVLDQPPGKGPLYFNWRDQNKLSDVKDQGLCGSCWAFATLGSLESQYAMKHNKLIDLSVQQMIDCDVVDAGCNGGLLHTAFEEIIKMGGVQLQSVYPYEADNGDCRMTYNNFAVRIKNCYRFIVVHEEKLKDLLRVAGPIPMSIDTSDIVNYKQGVIKYCYNNGLNHAVLLVGYGVENDTSYWQFKNSWGIDWGDDGYFKVQQNTNACGMNNELVSIATIY